MGLSVGIDLASVASVDESLREFGERFLERVYTTREVDDCRVGSTLSAARLAARFAAKEAAFKALRVPPDLAVPWRTVEVVNGPSGAPELRVTGEAADLAASGGVVELAVSLTREGPFAAAIVLATLA
jgi:holo-[acyl-carrier protein] synthase